MKSEYKPPKKLPFQGGSHPSRIEHIECLHLMYCNSPSQVYVVKELHRTPHYTIYPSQLENLLAILRVHKFDVENKVIEYRADRSHVDPDAFLQVYNDSTPEFNDISCPFELLNFQHAAEVAAKTDAGTRGNQIRCGGVTHQSLTGVHEGTGVSMPRFFARNEDFADSMANMSSLCRALLLDPDPDPGDLLAMERRQLFAEAIHPANFLEGISFLVYTAGRSEKCSDWATFLTKCHVDDCNAQTKGRNYLVAASRWVVDYAGISPGELPFLKRIAIVGYHRSVVDHFIRRMTIVRPVVNDLNPFWHSLAVCRQGLNYEFFLHFSFDRVYYPGDLFIMKSSINKTFFISTIVYTMYQVSEKYDLSLHQMIELVYVATLTSGSPYGFCCLLPRLMEKVNLKVDNLVLAFCELAQQDQNGIIGGVMPRCQVSLNKNISGSQINSSLDCIYHVITNANRNNKGITQTLYDNMVLDLKVGVHAVGDLLASHMVYILCLLGVLEDPAWCTFAKVAEGTETAEKLRKDYGVPTNDNAMVLQSVARKYQITVPEAECLMCEGTRKYQKYDFYTIGQSLLVIGLNDEKHPVVLRIDADGTVTRMHTFVSSEKAERNSFVRIKDNAIVPVFPRDGKPKSATYSHIKFLSRAESVAYYNRVKDIPRELMGEFFWEYQKERAKWPREKKKATTMSDNSEYLAVELAPDLFPADVTWANLQSYIPQPARPSCSNPIRPHNSSSIRQKWSTGCTSQFFLDKQWILGDMIASNHGKLSRTELQNGPAFKQPSLAELLEERRKNSVLIGTIFPTVEPTEFSPRPAEFAINNKANMQSGHVVDGDATAVDSMTPKTDSPPKRKQLSGKIGQSQKKKTGNSPPHSDSPAPSLHSTASPDPSMHSLDDPDDESWTESNSRLQKCVRKKRKKTDGKTRCTPKTRRNMESGQPVTQNTHQSASKYIDDESLRSYTNSATQEIQTDCIMAEDMDSEDVTFMKPKSSTYSWLSESKQLLQMTHGSGSDTNPIINKNYFCFIDLCFFIFAGRHMKDRLEKDLYYKVTVHSVYRQDGSKERSPLYYADLTCALTGKKYETSQQSEAEKNGSGIDNHRLILGREKDVGFIEQRYCYTTKELATAAVEWSLFVLVPSSSHRANRTLWMTQQDNKKKVVNPGSYLTLWCTHKLKKLITRPIFTTNRHVPMTFLSDTSVSRRSTIDDRKVPPSKHISTIHFMSVPPKQGHSSVPSYIGF